MICLVFFAGDSSNLSLSLRPIPKDANRCNNTLTRFSPTAFNVLGYDREHLVVPLTDRYLVTRSDQFNADRDFTVLILR